MGVTVERSPVEGQERDAGAWEGEGLIGLFGLVSNARVGWEGGRRGGSKEARWTPALSMSFLIDCVCLCVRVCWSQCVCACV